MSRQKVNFEGHDGETLAGLLELPDAQPRACAIFAHCFTCSKDIAAASRISRALTQHGIAVLRFDFTGLGNSDGDFSNTNFSSNVADLLQAANFLQSTYQAPALLIGHSLGGAAVLVAASQLSSVRAVVTIGAPASAKHVEHLFSDSKDAIYEHDEQPVSLGGRQFNIKKQFLQDLDQYSSTDHIRDLGKALLIFHSPVDNVVSIDEASRIYGAARHPKSFVSLDKADHLLSARADSDYVAAVVSAWVGKFVPDLDDTSSDAPQPGKGEVLIQEADKKFARQIHTNTHSFLADEPRKVGGADTGPDPYELLLSGLGACTSMTIRMYANHKKIPLEDVNITLRHSREHASDCEDCDGKENLLDVIERDIQLVGDLDEKTRARLMEIADRCPVHRTLDNEISIRSNEIR